MRKVASKTSIFHLVQLVLHTLVSGDSDSSRRPPLSHGRGKNSKRLLSPSHVSIVEFRINELQGSTNELGSAYTGLQYADQILVLKHSYILLTPIPLRGTLMQQRRLSQPVPLYHVEVVLMDVGLQLSTSACRVLLLTGCRQTPSRLPRHVVSTFLTFDKFTRSEETPDSHRSAIHLIEYEASDFETFQTLSPAVQHSCFSDQPFHRLASASDVR
jgi:hypothetical protein